MKRSSVLPVSVELAATSPKKLVATEGNELIL